jgi:deoxyribose-phosphate aldolase
MYMQSVFGEYHTDPASIQGRLEAYRATGLKSLSREGSLAFLLGSMDLTSLEGSDHEQKIIRICDKARSFRDDQRGIPAVAAVCFYSPFIRIARKSLRGSGIKVAAVGCAFPSGQAPLPIKLAEVKYAVEEGADEIDMVISRGTFLSGGYDQVFDEIAAVKAQCRSSRLKVILETGELESFANIRKASELAILAGADFIKTSTGKVHPAATPEAFVVMADTIREYYLKTGIMVGIKPAGGIADSQTALEYLVIVQEILGDAWMDNHYFRIGASKLADKVYRELTEA